MMVLKMNRASEDFYEVMGPVFGSRIIEQQTKDRFYDDPGKKWYVIPDQGAASVKDGVIRNFWAANQEIAEKLIQAMLRDYVNLRGIVPNAYEMAFEQSGFRTCAHRINFLEVRYVQDKRY